LCGTRWSLETYTFVDIKRLDRYFSGLTTRRQLTETVRIEHATPLRNSTVEDEAELLNEWVHSGPRYDLLTLIPAIWSRLLLVLAERNQNPKRYVWKASGEEILRKIQRARDALAQQPVTV